MDEKPAYLQIENLKKFKSFKQDSLERKKNTQSTVFDDKYMENYEYENAKFIEKFGHQFGSITMQNYKGIDYVFARSHEGYWLLELDNNKPKAYFLGLSFSHFSFNSIKNKNFIVNGFLQLEGSLV
ncbi:hypothetical protein ASG31_08780 [Chryseobacterium sp. Leaf404]|uniref:hypothetical protein n=1 Tax=unclassified Chryseobacterium TaxID=2593645 RepID=UPI0006F6D260|nr:MULTISPECIES: hypothetical protein [unclassified Chryseobacterium]KQT17492.1 hypothetical protein ASG31_08780 [Chryseobacterium sp. Leaf404]